MPESLFIKAVGLKARNVIKKRLQHREAPETYNFIKKKDSGTGVFLEFCEISKNTFSYRTPPVAASAYSYYKMVVLLVCRPPSNDKISY